MRPAVPESLRYLTHRQLARYMRETGTWLSGRQQWRSHVRQATADAGSAWSPTRRQVATVVPVRQLECDIRRVAEAQPGRGRESQPERELEAGA